MTERPAAVREVLALVGDVRRRLESLPRDQLARADASGELLILLGALDRVTDRIEQRCAALDGGGAEDPAAAPAAAPEEPRRREQAGERRRAPAAGEALSEVPAGEGRLSPPAMIALDMLQDGAEREQVAEYLTRQFGLPDPESVLAEVEAWRRRGGRGG